MKNKSRAGWGWRRRLLALVLSVLLILPAGCLSPSYLGMQKAYDADNAYLSAYALCYDAAVVAHGYPVPLIFGLKLERGSLGYELVTTSAIPISLVVAGIGGTLAAPAILIADLIGD